MSFMTSLRLVRPLNRLYVHIVPMCSSAKEAAEMSHAMKYYLEKKRSHDAFLAQERSEFELGKKHLANIMGMKVEEMTQKDIDQAIDYLFPSGLYHPDARPKMRPPDEIFPATKEIEFNYDGRPFHPFFYTVRPNFTQTLYELFDSIQQVSDLVNVQAPADLVLNDLALSTSRWMTEDEVRAALKERVKDRDASELFMALERLLESPHAYRFRDLIFKFRVPIAKSEAVEVHLEPKSDASGKLYVEMIGQRKNSLAQVRVTKPGTGRFSLSHTDHPDIECDISYFYSIKERMTVMYPLQFTKLLGQVDVECLVGPGGASAQAGAIRYALSVCLKSFVDADTAADMKVCGLLTQDIRVAERKKPGYEKARRRYTWKKR